MTSLLPCLSLILTIHGVGQGQAPDIRAYLDKALDIIEKNSIKRDFDFKKMRQAAYEATKDAKSTADTYPAIRAALESLKDHHSFFMEPSMAKTISSGRTKTAGLMCVDGALVQVRPDGPGYRAGLRRGMTLFELNGGKATADKPMMRLLAEAQFKGDPFTVRAGTSEKDAKVYRLEPAEISLWHQPDGGVVGGQFGYVHVPGFSGTDEDSRTVAAAIQTVLASADKSPLLGWIVDLRVDTGGNMYPMIAGLGPLLGERELGRFLMADSTEPWGYSRGASYAGKSRLVEIKNPVKLRQSDLPVAVLTSGYTASAGEATLISFLGDPRVRTFGTSTYGVPTGNETFPLSDGAMLVVCVCLEADRTGKAYDAAIPADVTVKQDWTKYRSNDDPTIAAAMRWIRKQSVDANPSLPARRRPWLPDTSVVGLGAQKN